ncbi:MAG TPA: MFS transporter [Longimicrobiales bacterium]
MYSRRRVFVAACLGMLMFGCVFATLGSILPSVIERFGIDKTSAGSLLLLQTFGVLLGSILFGPIVDRYGYKILLAVASALVVVALEAIAFAPSVGWLRAAVLLIGAAGGAVNGGTNALVADTSEGERSAGLSALGMFFGLGAVGMPFTVASLLDRLSYTTILAMIGAVFVAPVVYTLAIRFPAPKQPQGFPIGAGAALLRDPVLLLLAFMIGLQSGIEATVGGWSATFFRERLGLEGGRAVYVLSLYSLGLTLARLVLGFALRRVAPAAALRVCLVAGIVGSLSILASSTLIPAAAGIFLLGIGLSAGFPILMGYVGDRYAAISGTAFGVTIAGSLTVGMFLPYLTGLLGETYGLRLSFLIVPASLTAIVLLLSVAVRRAATVPAVSIGD